MLLITILQFTNAIYVRFRSCRHKLCYALNQAADSLSECPKLVYVFILFQLHLLQMKWKSYNLPPNKRELKYFWVNLTSNVLSNATKSEKISFWLRPYLSSSCFKLSNSCFKIKTRKDGSDIAYTSSKLRTIETKGLELLEIHYG